MCCLWQAGGKECEAPTYTHHAVDSSKASTCQQWHPGISLAGCCRNSCAPCHIARRREIGCLYFGAHFGDAMQCSDKGPAVACRRAVACRVLTQGTFGPFMILLKLPTDSGFQTLYNGGPPQLSKVIIAPLSLNLCAYACMKNSYLAEVKNMWL
jgi:hypothetical protein